MRLLFLLLIAGVGAYFTVPTREAHEEAARVFLEQRAQEQTGAASEGQEAEQRSPFSLDAAIDFVTGMMAGQGRYESFYVLSKYTLDLPGAAYLECYGAFTFVRCSEAGTG